MNEVVTTIKSESPKLHRAIQANHILKTLMESVVDMAVASTLKKCMAGNKL